MAGFISVHIDDFTPCLKDNSTGELVDTEDIQWMCSAPQNNKLLTENIKYSGVGGHLFAIAGKKSEDYGYNGDVFGFAASEKLLGHYVEKLGAVPICMLHQFHFGIFSEQMKNIMEVYTYDWTDEEI